MIKHCPACGRFDAFIPHGSDRCQRCLCDDFHALAVAVSTRRRPRGQAHPATSTASPPLAPPARSGASGTSHPAVDSTAAAGTGGAW